MQPLARGTQKVQMKRDDTEGEEASHVSSDQWSPSNMPGKLYLVLKNHLDLDSPLRLVQRSLSLVGHFVDT